MTLEERSRLSYYHELAPLQAEHGVFLMQHRESGMLFVKKTLINYQTDIFLSLKDHPVPNMPRIYEAIEDDGCLIVIESYLPGKTLHQLLLEQGPLPQEEACRILLQLCDILAHLHARGIIHRDIKPSNIILTEENTVRLLDLDAAKVYRPEEQQDTRLIGTKGYAAPEQYGFSASSPVTDIYAAGVLLNVLVTGELPASKKTADPVLNGIIARCTRMEPASRYQSVEELKAALTILLSAETRPQSTAVVRKSPPSSLVRFSVPVASSESVREDLRHPSHVPPFAPAPFASGAAVSANQQGIKRLTPPGFRTGTPWKKLLAVIWYCLSFLMLFSIVGKQIQEGRPWFSILIYSGYVFLLLFGLPVFLCNYLNLWSRLKIDRISYPFLRFLLAFLLYAGLVVLYVIFFSEMVEPF